MSNFSDFDLHSDLTDALTKMQYLKPTPIQTKTIPLSLEGKDILASAQTGTGKTGAFLIPIITKLINTEEITAIVLSPTRELAKQIHDVAIQMLSFNNDIKINLLIGGEHIDRQLRCFKRNPRFIIGTPGRINDHLNRRSLNLNKCAFLVLDETDRMLDMGFGMQIDEIVQQMPTQRQTLMFSATLPKNITNLAAQYLIKPERIGIETVNQVAPNLTQETLRITNMDKYGQLVKELDKRGGSILIFIKTKINTAKIVDQLLDDGHSACELHGDMRQRLRDRSIKSFTNKRCRIMVATDVAARGLDIDHIEHVINFDLPQSPEDYVHRIGRTARAGKKGNAMSFITVEDHRKWREIEYFLDPTKKSANSSSGRSSNRAYSKYGSSPNNKYNSRSSGNYNPRSNSNSNYNSGRSSSNNRFGNSSSDNSRSNYNSNYNSERSSSNNRFGNSSSDNPRSNRNSNYNSGRSSSNSRFGSGASENSRSNRNSNYNSERSSSNSRFGNSSSDNPRSNSNSNYNSGRSSNASFNNRRSSDSSNSSYNKKPTQDNRRSSYNSTPAKNSPSNS